MQGNLQQGRNQGATTSASPLTPSNSSHHLARPLLINAVLSFIKVCRLKGDVGSLRKKVCEHFSPDDVENAKRLLWDHCKQPLEAAGLIHHSRRGSDRRSQLVANLDDILQSFVALDSSDLIPGIYCEATDLLRVPSLSLDPVSEKVEMNTFSLQELASKIDLFEAKISSIVFLKPEALLVRPPMQLLLPPTLQCLLL